ncbi:MAG TPA: FAD-binding oxidoreductase [Acidimicrobiales bacterium]|nr:FAD-binding oxidoreductase [Acidimicrobiales bacterium]
MHTRRRRTDPGAAIAAAKPVSFWLDDPAAPKPELPLSGTVPASLAVVGAGFTGLWTAFLAKQADPDLDVVLLESERVGWAATGRNGGFAEASLTHGEANGRARFPQSFERLEQLGLENLGAIEQFVRQHRVECGWERTGQLTVATQPWQLEMLRGAGDPPRGWRWLDHDALVGEVASPTYLGGMWDLEGCAMLNPARLAWAIRAACLESGVRIFEHTPVLGMSGGLSGLARGPGGTPGRRVELQTPSGRVEAERVALATNAFNPLLRRVRARIVPVYDHVLVTEPLTDGQLEPIGWRHRQGLTDGGNQFHYYRLTDDNRILWGGWDAVYHLGRKVKPAYDQRFTTFRTLARHFHETFPHLSDVGFSHRWGGAIDTCGRFCAFFGTASAGRVAYAAGYTGMGVAASRFGARVMLDLLSGGRTELTELDLVRSKPLPFPPEPFTWFVVQATRRSIAQADRRGGERNAWLRLLDRLGLGYDS